MQTWVYRTKHAANKVNTWSYLVGVTNRMCCADDGNRMPSWFEARRRAAGERVAMDKAEERADPKRGVLLQERVSF